VTILQKIRRAEKRRELALLPFVPFYYPGRELTYAARGALRKGLKAARRHSATVDRWNAKLKAAK